MKARFILLVALASILGAPGRSAAATQVQLESGTVEVLANFTALSLNDQSDLKGTSVAVRKISAWVSIVDPTAANAVHKIRLIKWLCVEPAPTKSNCPTAGDPALYYVADADYQVGYESSWGVSYGILAVPFKYHFSDHAVTAGSTLGGYLGVTQDVGFTQISEIIGGGLALVSSTAATSNFTAPTSGSGSSPGTPATPTTSTLTGLSVATGILGKIGHTNTQFGILVGIDAVEKSASYKYNSKLWLSFSLGYNFAN